MALYDTTWYANSVGYAAVTVRPQNTAVAAGGVRRQFTTPAVNSERCFVCIIAGTTANVADATWVLTRGAKTTDGTATWQECTGQPAVNGDLSSTATWAQVKAVTPAVLGQIIKRSNNASYQICTTAGAMSVSEPTFSDTAGVTTTDTTAVWTSLGPVSNFPAWSAPHARLFNAYAANWGAAGNKFWLADNHAETQVGAMTLTSPATAAAGPTYVICVDRTAALPPVEANYNTGATITTTGASDIIVQTAASGFGSSYYQGIVISGGSGSSAAAPSFKGNGSNIILKNCGISSPNTTVNGGIFFGATGLAPLNVLLDNTWVQFGAVANKALMFNGYVCFEWRNTPDPVIHGAIIPTVPLFFLDQSVASAVCVCRGVDFSIFPGTLVSPISPIPIVFEDCKFHSGMIAASSRSTGGYAATPVITVRCDSGATNYKAARDEYSGAQSVETSITRVGGATDGTTTTGDKIVTSSTAAFLTPYRMLPLAIWNETTGADVTVTVYGTVNSASLPKDDEIWMDVQYLGSSGSPVASFKSTAKSHPLAANAAVASDGSTWNGGGSGAGWSPFKLTATLTSPQPGMKGYIYARGRVAKPSATFYLDPQITLS